jgi:pyruvate formate lyase activating enzyme
MDSLYQLGAPSKPSRETVPAAPGLILHIMRFSLHDGPGIRTTVFLKGCPLRCWWCHNPESQLPEPEIIYNEERCIGCGDCVRACPEAALHLDERVIHDPGLCQRCGECVNACSAGARELAGRWMSVPEVMTEVLKDRIFFDESCGGITVSGGEPLMQAAFVEALLDNCRARRIRTVLDTCGFADSTVICRVSKNVDLFLYDLKLMDRERHLRFTGVRNDSILQNLKMLAERGCAVIVRIPVIPGVNDDSDNINALSSFLSSLHLLEIELLPYHRIASNKYHKLQLSYRMEGVVPPPAEQMESIALHLRHDGFRVRIGG